jgi:hypothetical protein
LIATDEAALGFMPGAAIRLHLKPAANIQEMARKSFHKCPKELVERTSGPSLLCLLELAASLGAC